MTKPFRSNSEKGPAFLGWITARAFIGMLLGFFLALSVWGSVSGARRLMTVLEIRLHMLQDQLTILQDQVDMLTRILLAMRQEGADTPALARLREQLEIHKHQLATMNELRQ